MVTVLTDQSEEDEGFGVGKDWGLDWDSGWVKVGKG